MKGNYHKIIFPIKTIIYIFVYYERNYKGDFNSKSGEKPF